MSLVELVLTLHARLDDAQLPHAFGGALALAQVAEPRATVDIDVNVFLPLAELARIGAALATIDLTSEAAASPVPVSGVRFRRPGSPYPVDVFPSLDPRYEVMAGRVEHHRFGPDDAMLPFLSPEDLAVFKLSFGRPKDWVDLHALVASRSDLDVEYVEDQIIGLRGSTMYPRVARLRAMVDQAQRK